MSTLLSWCNLFDPKLYLKSYSVENAGPSPIQLMTKESSCFECTKIKAIEKYIVLYKIFISKFLLFSPNIRSSSFPKISHIMG